jgi:transposase
MSVPLARSSSSIGSVVDSGWGERGGERSEPERDHPPESTTRNADDRQHADPKTASIPNPEVMPKAQKAKRRRFKASDKLRILQATDEATEFGEVGRILRREGIYHSQLYKWREERAAGLAAGLASGLAGKAPGVKAPDLKALQQENLKLERQNARLEKELKRAEIIIEFQKKAAALFETTKATEES